MCRRSTADSPPQSRSAQAGTGISSWLVSARTLWLMHGQVPSTPPNDEHARSTSFEAGHPDVSTLRASLYTRTGHPVGLWRPLGTHSGGDVVGDSTSGASGKACVGPASAGSLTSSSMASRIIRSVSSCRCVSSSLESAKNSGHNVLV
jgi:hypothetical protein